MLGRKEFRPKFFYHLCLEAYVPQDHLLRRVAAGVDLSFVPRLTARFYSQTGQPGIDPVVLFKMALLGWLYGITSERRLADECRLNLVFRWFLGYDLDERPPDHSVLSKARARFGVTVYQAFFTEIVRQCEQAGLIRGNQLYVDSTLTEANASLDSMGARALVAQFAGADDHLAALSQANAGERAAEQASPPAPPPAAAASATGVPMGPRPRSATDPPNAPLGLLNARLVSRTDPDAALVARDKVPPGLYYKVHIGVDGGAARLLTAVEVTSGEVGDEQLPVRLIREHVGSTGRTVAEVVADTKYGTQANYVALEAAQIRASIRPFPGGGIRRALRARALRVRPGGRSLPLPGGASPAPHGPDSHRYPTGRDPVSGGPAGVSRVSPQARVLRHCGSTHHHPPGRWRALPGGAAARAGNPDEFDALLLPGGALNADSMRMVPEVPEFVRRMQATGKPMAVICHAPWILVSTGLVKDRRLTSYPHAAGRCPKRRRDLAGSRGGA